MVVFDQDRALGFDRVAKTTFAPIYPVIAGQILEKTGITEGKCVDVGGGPGYPSGRTDEQTRSLASA